MSTSCPVCCEKFTKRKRHPVACPGCEYTACTECVCRYLCTTTDAIARCMQCKQTWHRQFLVNNTPSSFHNKRWREHEAQRLLAAERSKLPRAQQLLEARDRAEVAAQEWEAASEDVRRAQGALMEAKSDQSRKRLTLENARHQAHVDRLVEAELTGSTQQTPAWVSTCPKDECRGFMKVIETDMGASIRLVSCSLCNTMVCAECMQEISDIEEPHVCNEDTKASITAMREESRPCPSCRVPIFRISGCDQMWCTSCHTPFSWRTQQILHTGVLHNPHYIAWRDANTGQADVPPVQGCAGGLAIPWVTLEEINEAINSNSETRPRLPPVTGSIVLAIASCIRNAGSVHLYRYPASAEHKEAALARIRLQYMQGLFDTDAWRSKVRRVISTEDRNMAKRDLLNTFLYSGHDILERILFEDSLELRCDAVLSMVRLVQWFNLQTIHLEGKKKLMIVTQEQRSSTNSKDHSDAFESLFAYEQNKGSTPPQSPITSRSFIRTSPPLSRHVNKNTLGWRALNLHPLHVGVLRASIQEV